MISHRDPLLEISTCKYLVFEHTVPRTSCSQSHRAIGPSQLSGMNPEFSPSLVYDNRHINIVNVFALDKDNR